MPWFKRRKVEPVSAIHRARACLLGAGIGDAWGAPYEFRSGPVNVRDEYDRGVFGTPPGGATDDSTLVRLHAEAWVEVANGDPAEKLWPAFEQAYARNLVRWKDSHPPDIGAQTSSSIELLRRGRRPEETSRSGNGSLMAVAPLGIVASSPADAARLAGKFSDLTHCNAASRLACGQVAAAINALIGGAVPQDVWTRYGLPLPAGHDIDGGSMGFSLVAAGLAFEALSQFNAGSGAKGNWSSFYSVLKNVLTQGGDTDTNGAIAGALVGAAATPGQIKPAWMIDGLIEADELTFLADELVQRYRQS